MGEYLQILGLVIAGIILLWFGYSLFFGPMSPFYPIFFRNKKRVDNKSGVPGDPQVCPVCSKKLIRGELVKTMAFPSVTGGKDRLMYIRGCQICLYDDIPRYCPICGVSLNFDDYLISRMFERPNDRNHVHILGCNYCKHINSMMK
ncbi:MAG: DUF3185 family protein [Treponema sp.]|jgi:RNA polymerase subunit RPABC4/transcription elongation factor Spt4|nr:DUF3185 family protein [Treponema sp.]